MINKKFICGVMSTVLLASSSNAWALTFNDVENDPTVAWAKPYINKMTDAGYIKGYEDSTFRPTKNISKAESLILLSRMIGVDEAAYKTTAANALKKYQTTLSEYSTPYKNEVAFLLYNGVLKTSELSDYIGNSVANTGLKRYEAAILITKLLGAEEDVLNNSFISSVYADTVEIPAVARPYVEYVKTTGIMEGMGNNENGQPVFSPNTTVTRAQMAKMLACIIEQLGKTTTNGTVTKVDDFNDSFTANVDGLDIQYTISDSTMIMKNNSDVGLSSVKTGDYVRITHLNGKISLVEVLDEPASTVKYGIISKLVDQGNIQQLIVSDVDDTEALTTYTVNSDCKIIIKSATSMFSNLTKDSYVKLSIDNGVLTRVEVLEKTGEVRGTVVTTSLDGENVVIEIKNSKDVIEKYLLKSGVSITRNGLDATVRELAAGDKIVAKTTYGKISKLTAESSSKKISGILESVTLSQTQPKITVIVDNKSMTYNIYAKAEVLIDDEKATLTDLHLGSAVELTFESDEVKKISSTSQTAKTQVSGTVKIVNRDYGLIIVETTDGTEEQVFINTKTKFIDTTAAETAEISIKSVKKGQSVLVTGTNSGGVFEAGVVIIQ